MKRRSVCAAIATLGTTRSGVPQAQTRSEPRRVGYLANIPPTDSGPRALVEAFTSEMRRLGWVEGKNISYEFRFANGKGERFDTLARELVATRVDVIAAMNTPAAFAAKRATTNIPIVFVAAEPVGYGLVKSLQQPGGNLTGLTFALLPLLGKRMQLLTQLVPRMKRLAYLGAGEQRAIDAAQVATKALGLDLVPVDATPTGGALELPGAIAQGAAADAWLVDDYPQFYTQRAQIFELIAAQRKPAMYSVPYWVAEGALVAYAQDTVSVFMHAADYVDRILRGAKPAEMPVEEPAKFVLAVNLRTARALGITIPYGVLLQANEVIG